MTEKQFATLPVKTIFFRLSLPGIFSMVFSSLYMMADGVFVGRYVGADALAAVNLVMPLMMIVLAVPNMIAVGSSVKVSTALGAHDEEKARRLFSASVGIVMGLGAVFTVLGLLFLKPLVYFTIQDKALAALAYDYARYFVYAMPLICPLFAMDNFLRACGRAKYSMVVNVLVSVLNVVLDWLLIVVLRRGIAASAMASVLSMLVGSLFSFLPFFTKKLTLHFTRPQISLREVWGIVYNGSSEFFSGIAGSVVAAIVNGFLLALGGNLAVASYSIVMYIDALLISVLYGVTDAIQPAVSYNYGAGKGPRTLAFFKVAGWVTAALSLLCLAVILLFPGALAGIFVKEHNTEMLRMTTLALQLYAPSYLFTWYNMLTSAFLTALDRPAESMLIMLFRAIVFPVACLFALTPAMGVNGVFFMETVSGALTFVVAACIWHKYAGRMRGSTPA